MNPAEEQAYVQGRRAAWLTLLHECLKELGYDSPEFTATRWVTEREDAIRSLRSLCRDFGDNEWDEALHLQDIIDKHLADHLLKIKRILAAYELRQRQD